MAEPMGPSQNSSMSWPTPPSPAVISSGWGRVSMNIGRTWNMDMTYIPCNSRQWRRWEYDCCVLSLLKKKLKFCDHCLITVQIWKWLLLVAGRHTLLPCELTLVDGSDGRGIIGCHTAICNKLQKLFMSGLNREEEWASWIGGQLPFQSSGGADDVHVCCELCWHLRLLSWPGTRINIFILRRKELVGISCVMVVTPLSRFLACLHFSLFLRPLLLPLLHPSSLGCWIWTKPLGDCDSQQGFISAKS